MPNLSKNKGEWSEVYIFLKLLIDGKVYAADKNLKKIPTAFLNILKILREEIAGKVYAYVPAACVPDNVVHIYRNGVDTSKTCTTGDLTWQKDYLWMELNHSHGSASFTIPLVESFLNSIFITKTSSPARAVSKMFGGTVDITMDVSDYKTGLSHVVGFSCKSEFAAKSTLFNASHDNTNFVYKVVGNIDDALMEQFNNTFTTTGAVAIGERIQLLKDTDCTLEFLNPAMTTAEANLVMSGGLEMPKIVGEVLRHYYFDNNGKRAGCSIEHAIDNLAKVNPVGYPANQRMLPTYRKKMADLLFDMFTGMKLRASWDGRRTVNGGYIVALASGDVLAYHSCLEDEFKDFLISRLGLESPSCSRHEFMSIYKVGDEYRLKLNLQIRFIARQTT